MKDPRSHYDVVIILCSRRNSRARLPKTIRQGEKEKGEKENFPISRNPSPEDAMDASSIVMDAVSANPDEDYLDTRCVDVPL